MAGYLTKTALAKKTNNNHPPGLSDNVQKPGSLVREDLRRLTTHFAGDVLEFFSFTLSARTNTSFISCGEFFPVDGGQIKLVWPG